AEYGAGSLMHEVNEPRQHVGVGSRQHTVAEVEDVTARGSSARDDIGRSLLDDLPRSENHCWVEISLQRVDAADALRCNVERYSPVDAHDIGARFTHERK